MARARRGTPLARTPLAGAAASGDDRGPPRPLGPATMKPRVLVTRHVYPQTIAVLAEAASPIYRDRREVPTIAELQRMAADCEGIVCQLTDPITAEVLAAAPRLRVVAQVAVGVDNIDVAAATARNIVVTN